MPLETVVPTGFTVFRPVPASDVPFNFGVNRLVGDASTDLVDHGGSDTKFGAQIHQ